MVLKGVSVKMRPLYLKLHEMKKTLFICLMHAVCMAAWCPPSMTPSNKSARQKLHEAKWERMIAAITYVESRNDDRAYNKASGALGRFQMKKIYVDDVNRIASLKKLKKRYKYSDRTNPLKSREMFDILQGHYNPEKNIEKAIKIHRGRDSKPYRDAVLNEMKIVKINN